MIYKLAIFDMDGTILDTLDDLVNAMNYILREYNMPERSRDEIRRFVGNGIHKLVERSVPEGTPPEKIEEIFKTFNAYYKDRCAIHTKPYDGITEVLKKLSSKCIHTAVVSNKRDEAVRNLCNDYFNGLFEYFVGDKDGQRRKPYPDSVNAVLEFFGIERKDAVYIGDSEVDFQTAKNAEMSVIMVGWGFRTEEELHLAGATEIVHSMDELYKKITE